MNPKSVNNRLLASTLLLVLLLEFGLLTHSQGETRASKASPPGAPDLTGRIREPLGKEAERFNVLLFVRTDCPISNRYAPEIMRLQRTFGPRGVSFWLVYPDPDESGALIARHQSEYGLTLPTVRDPAYRLVHFAHIRVIPEAALFTRGGRELYHGRIDNRDGSIGQSRPEPTVRDLADAISAALEEKPILRPVTRAVGCILEKVE